MKKLLLLMLTLVMSVTAWAETFVLGNWTTKPVPGSNSLTVNATLADDHDNNWSVSLVGSNAEKNPSQAVQSGTTYWQIGANGNMTTATFSTSDITSTITSIVVDCAAYKGLGKVNVTVGGVAFGTQDQDMPAWASSAGGELTFTGSASGEIVVTMAPTEGGRAIYLSSITVTDNTKADPIDATFTFSETSVEVEAGKTAVVTMTTNFDGELIVDSYNTSVATATYDAVSGKITITGVAAGTTQIGILGDETSKYKEVDEVIDVKVVGSSEPKPLAPGVLFYESFDQNTGTGGNDDNWNGNIANNTLMLDNEGWTTENGSGAYQCAKFGSGSKQGKATTPGINYSGDCTLVFMAAAWDKTGEKTTLKLSADGATLSEESVTLKLGEWDIYEVNITNATPGFTITFSGASASNSRFFLDEVEVSLTPYQLTIGATKWATLCLDYSYAAPEGVKFYSVATATAEGVELHEVTTGVKGSLAVLANAAAGTYRVKATDDYDSNFPNLLEGVAVDTPCAANENYVLGDNGNGTVSFGLYHGTTLKANRAYLPASVVPEGARANLTIDVETGIEQIATDQQLLFGKVYDLQGRELQSLQKGFNIMNGKKVIVK